MGGRGVDGGLNGLGGGAQNHARSRRSPPRSQIAKEAKAARVNELQRAGEHAAAKEVKKKDVDTDAYTFMSTNPKVLSSLDYGRGEYFGFHLLNKTAISTRTIDLMRALLDAGAPGPASSLRARTRLRWRGALTLRSIGSQASRPRG